MSFSRNRVSLLALVVFVSACTAPAQALTGSAPSRRTTATAIRIGDHPGFVRVVVDLRDPAAHTNGGTYATDPYPADGHAGVRFGIVGVRTTAAPVLREGVSARLRQGHNFLDLGIGSARRRFKYLSWFWLGNDRLVVDLWKSAPPSPAAEISRGENGCLTLQSVHVSRAGVVSASGRESNVFEHQFLARVRSSSGSVLAQRNVHSRAGRWSVALAPNPRRRQPGTFEALARSPADGSLVCLVQRRIELPAPPVGLG